MKTAADSRRPRYTFFVDRSLGGIAIPEALTERGFTVVRHDDRFPDPQTPDTEWLGVVGREGWLGLSKDRNILKNRLERAALETAKARFFYLPRKSRSGEEQVELVIRNVDQITRAAEKIEPPIVGRLTPSGLLILVGVEYRRLREVVQAHMSRPDGEDESLTR